MNEETEDLKNMIIHLVGLVQEYCDYEWFKEVDNAGAEIMNRLDELQAFKDKQEQGLLIELPCKVGDTLYMNDSRGVYMGLKDAPYEVQVAYVVFTDAKDFIEVICEDGNMFQFYFSNIGKTIFLTRSEAEEALAKMGGK